VPLLLGLLLAWSALAWLLSDNRSLAWYGDAYRRDGLMSYLLYGGIFAVAWQLRGRRQSSLDRSSADGGFRPAGRPGRYRHGAAEPGLPPDPVTSVFYNANHYGYFLALTAPGALYLMSGRRHHVKAVLAGSLVLFALIAASLNLNQSLGPFLGVVVALLFALAVTCWLRQPVKPVLLVIGLFAAVSVLVNLIQPRLLADLLRLSRDTQLIASGSPEAMTAGSSRWILWVNGMQMERWKGRFSALVPTAWAPPIWPAGSRSTAAQRADPACGKPWIPAVVFYLLALLAVAVDFIRNRARNGRLRNRVLLTMVAAYFVSSLVGNSMFYTTPFYFCVLGLAAGRIRAASREEMVSG
jgi:hypothetical protein